MKELIHDMELTERFLSGTLTEKEKEKFAQRFDTDKEFNQLVQDMDQLIDGIRQSGNKTTIEEKIRTLKSFAKEDSGEKEKGKTISLFKRRISSQARYLIAASLLLFAAAVFVVVQQLKFVPQPDLYAKYFEPFDSPGSGLTRSGTNGVSIKAEAYEAYDAGNYTKAAELFEQSLAQQDEAIVNLCLANSYMALNEFEKAEAILFHLLKAHTDLVTQTKWYLALTYLKQNKQEKARATLWEISDSSTYGEKAKRLLMDLD